MTSFSSIFMLQLIPVSWNPPVPAGGEMRYNPREVALSSTSRNNSYNISLSYSDLSKDFTEKLIHAHFILKKLIFFLDNNWQGD